MRQEAERVLRERISRDAWCHCALVDRVFKHVALRHIPLVPVHADACQSVGEHPLRVAWVLWHGAMEHTNEDSWMALLDDGQIALAARLLKVQWERPRRVTGLFSDLDSAVASLPAPHFTPEACAEIQARWDQVQGFRAADTGRTHYVGDGCPGGHREGAP